MRIQCCISSILIATALAAQAAPPTIWNQPQDQTADSGTYAQFDAGEFAPSEDGPVYYQWYREGVPLPWAAGTKLAGVNYYVTLYITNVMASDSAGYYVVLTNRAGSVTSEVAQLTVLMSEPVSQDDFFEDFVCEGQYLYLYRSAVGSHPMYYQWQLNGTNLPGGYLPMPDCTPGNAGCSVASWLISSASQSDAGDYTVAFTNEFGATTSAVTRLTVNASPPVIDTSPASQTVLEGDTVFFSAFVSSCATHFQWRHDGIALPNNDSTQLYFPYVHTNDAGDYVLVASNSHGAVTSAVAHLTVNQQAPQILQGPSSLTVFAGGSAAFSVLVRAGPPAALQWRFNGHDIPGATNSSLGFYVTSTNQAGGYSLFASNRLGSVTSDVAMLTVVEVAPHFDTEPISQAAIVGDTVTLTAAANGNPPPTYQWRFNGMDIPDAKSFSLSFFSVTTNNAGDYSVVAMNEAGSVTSRVATLIVSPPGPLDRWHWRNPLPQGDDLREVGYGNGIFVALGNDGTKVSSADGGVSWHDRTEGKGWVGGIAYGLGLFVRVGWDSVSYKPVIETSPDGAVWTKRAFPAGTYGQFNDVAFGNGRFVAVGYPYVLVSTNGVEWVRYPLGLPVLHLAFGNGMFVGIEGYSDGELAVSTNGESWIAQQASVGGYTTDISFGVGQFVVCGWDYSETPPYYYEAFAVSSVDAVSWTGGHAAFDFQPASIAYGTGKFVMVGGFSNGVAAVSTDARNWISTTVPQSHELYGVGFGGGTFVAVGNYGNIVTSTDGQNWTARSSGSDVNLRSVIRGGSTFLAVGNEGLWFSSSNGVSWTRRPPPTTNNIRSVTFGKGASGNALFAAVGEADVNGTTVLTSSNGVSWTRLQTPTSLGLYGITFADGIFVAVGEGILTSSDGANWPVTRSVSGERLNAVTHGAGMFAAVGRSGKILVSGSGTIWAQRSAGTTAFWQGVAYGNGRFVAGGQATSVAISTNGAEWTLQPTALAEDIEDITFANNLFLAVGNNGFLASSPDGVVWTRHRPARRPDLRGVTYVDGRFLVVGNNESILQSGFSGPPILRVRSLASEGFEFSVDGEMGRSYRLQGSMDLHNWTDLISFSNNEETTLFLDADAEDFAQRFYRVVSP